jgi:hypothetical protein
MGKSKQVLYLQYIRVQSAFRFPMLVAYIERESEKREGRFVSGLELLFGLKKEGEKEGLWVGHSVFQLPVTVHRYKGAPESLVLAYLYEFASGISFHSSQPIILELRVSQDKIAEKTGLALRSVPGAIQELEADNCIRVVRTRNEDTGQVELNVYLLLHSTTQEPLRSRPKVWDICHENSVKPYITAPKTLLKSLTPMTPGARAVYLAALSLASVRTSMIFTVTREDWKTETLLGRNAFNRGLKECAKSGLLKYKRNTITLHDPLTRKPSTKTRQQPVYHEGAQWKFNLDAITADEWQRVAERLLKRSVTVSASGWTNTTADGLCPFCTHARSFTMHFDHSQWKCHHCGKRGRMFQLVQQVLRESQAQRVREYITEVIGPAQSEAPQLVTVADGHAEI